MNDEKRDEVDREGAEVEQEPSAPSEKPHILTAEELLALQIAALGTT